MIALQDRLAKLIKVSEATRSYRTKVRKTHRTRGVRPVQFQSHQTTIKLRRSGIIVIIIQQFERYDKKENVQFGELF